MLHHANEEEGERVFEIAKRYFASKNYYNAVKFGEKAKRMLSKSSKLLKELNDMIRAASEHIKEMPAQNNETKKPDLKERKTQKVPTEESAQFDEKLERKCRSILQMRDYYKILGVSTESSAEEIKKAFRKLALQLHPDKSNCPSAEAAFKEVSRAYQCLSNEESRKNYDIHGYPTDDSEQPRYDTFNTTYMTHQQVFETFFGSSIPGNFQYHFHTTRRRQQPYQGNLNLVQIFPLLLILSFWFMSSIIDYFTAAPYSLYKSSSYPLGRATSLYDTPYYVNSKFDRNYPANSKYLKKIETQIDLAYTSRKCMEDLQHTYSQLQALRFYGTTSRYRQKYYQLRSLKNNSTYCQNYTILKKANPYIQFPLPRFGSTTIDPDDI